MMTMKNFIVLEGIDGSGTTTQAARLHAALLEEGMPSLLTCEPSDGPIGRLIRQQLADPHGARGEALSLLFSADRRMHVQTFQGHETVICDRYVLSAWVYQGLELELDRIRINDQGLPVPSITVLIDIDPELGAKRRAERGLPSDHFEKMSTQRAIAARYLTLIQDFTGRTAVIDGSRSVDEVGQAIMDAISPSLERGTP